MPAVLAPSLQTAVRDWFRGTTFVAAPVTLWLALYTTTPTGASGGTEVTGGAYARVAITTATGFITDGTGKFTNAADIVFATSTLSWGTVVGWALMDALTAGTRRAFGTFTTSQSVGSGKIVKVLAGKFGVDLNVV